MSEFDNFLSRMDAEGMELPVSSEGGDGDGLCVRIEESREHPAYETQASASAGEHVAGGEREGGDVSESTNRGDGLEETAFNQTSDQFIVINEQAEEKDPAMGSAGEVPEQTDSAVGGQDEDPSVSHPEKRISLRKDSSVVIDPTFPSELIEEQEDFIFSVPVNEETPPEPVPLNKWEKYALRVCKLSRTLARKSKTILRKDGEQRSVFGFQIYTLKKRIKAVLHELVQEYGNDTRFPDLEAGNEEEDMVNVEDVVCSRCGLSDTPDNDILLCDKQGCCRAYHQNCLDPKVDPSAIKDEAYWFCWVCDAMNNCLAWINTKMGTSFEKPEDVFPGLDDEAAEWDGKYPADFYDPENPKPLVPKDENKVSRRRSKVVESSSESEGMR